MYSTADGRLISAAEATELMQRLAAQAEGSAAVIGATGPQAGPPSGGSGFAGSSGTTRPFLFGNGPVPLSSKYLKPEVAQELAKGNRLSAPVDGGSSTFPRFGGPAKPAAAAASQVPAAGAPFRLPFQPPPTNMAGSLPTASQPAVTSFGVGPVPPAHPGAPHGVLPSSVPTSVPSSVPGGSGSQPAASSQQAPVGPLVPPSGLGGPATGPLAGPPASLPPSFAGETLEVLESYAIRPDNLWKPLEVYNNARGSAASREAAQRGLLAGPRKRRTLPPPVNQLQGLWGEFVANVTASGRGLALFAPASGGAGSTYMPNVIRLRFPQGTKSFLSSGSYAVAAGGTPPPPPPEPEVALANAYGIGKRDGPEEPVRVCATRRWLFRTVLPSGAGMGAPPVAASNPSDVTALVLTVASEGEDTVQANLLFHDIPEEDTFAIEVEYRVKGRSCAAIRLHVTLNDWPLPTLPARVVRAVTTYNVPKSGLTMSGPDGPGTFVGSRSVVFRKMCMLGVASLRRPDAAILALTMDGSSVWVFSATSGSCVWVGPAGTDTDPSMRDMTVVPGRSSLLCTSAVSTLLIQRALVPGFVMAAAANRRQSQFLSLFATEPTGDVTDPLAIPTRLCMLPFPPGVVDTDGVVAVVAPGVPLETGDHALAVVNMETFSVTHRVGQMGAHPGQVWTPWAIRLAARGDSRPPAIVVACMDQPWLTMMDIETGAAWTTADPSPADGPDPDDDGPHGRMTSSGPPGNSPTHAPSVDIAVGGSGRWVATVDARNPSQIAVFSVRTGALEDVLHMTNRRGTAPATGTSSRHAISMAGDAIVALPTDPCKLYWVTNTSSGYRLCE